MGDARHILTTKKNATKINRSFIKIREVGTRIHYIDRRFEYWVIEEGAIFNLFLIGVLSKNIRCKGGRDGRGS